MRSTILIRNQRQEKKLSKITQQKQKQVKEKRGEKLFPEEGKVAKLYKAGKLKGKTFDNLDKLHKDLNQESVKKKNVVKTKMNSPPLSDDEIADKLGKDPVFHFSKQEIRSVLAELKTDKNN